MAGTAQGIAAHGQPGGTLAASGRECEPWAALEVTLFKQVRGSRTSGPRNEALQRLCFQLW